MTLWRALRSKRPRCRSRRRGGGARRGLFARPGPHKVGDKSSASDGIQPKVNFPAADLKPLYDFAVDCKACQAKLGAAQADLADETLKSQALGKERDDALRAAKGGSVLRRIASAAKWFAIGAAAGAVAAKATR